MSDDYFHLLVPAFDNKVSLMMTDTVRTDFEKKDHICDTLACNFIIISGFLYALC